MRGIIKRMSINFDLIIYIEESDIHYKIKLKIITRKEEKNDI